MWYGYDVFSRVGRSMLLQFRREYSISQKQLAALLGVSRQFISLVESGRRSISFELLCRLADLKNWSMEEFLRRYAAVWKSECRAEKCGSSQLPLDEGTVRLIAADFHEAKRFD